MNEELLRPKYSVEQYIIFFQFSGTVLGLPNVEVEVVTGEDPFPETFAGLARASGDVVSCVVTGGNPGCVYKVIVSANVNGEQEDQAGVIAVLPTDAEVPGAPLPPPTILAVSTTPYPYWYEDSLNVVSEVLEAAIYQFPVDEVVLNSFALDGVLRELIKYYTMEPEELDIISYSLDGTLRALVVYYSLADEFDIVSYPLNGVLRDILIPYLNYPPEEFNITSYALDGTLANL